MLQPKLLSKIWAALGLKNSIPDSRSDGLAQGAATYDEGFPSITMTPIAQGGKAPSGKDMNGVLNELSAHIVHLNKGGLYKFDVTFAGKINGYDKGAVLLNDAETAFFVSLVSQNKHNFNTSLDYSKYWAKLADVQSVKHITPLKLTSQTQNTLLPNGHTHEIEKASLTEVGITKLSSGLDSDAEDMAATPKAIKTLKDLIDAITRNLGNYIPNSKKSNAIDSNSADTVATSFAAKTAYDKGVEAKTAVDNLDRIAYKVNKSAGYAGNATALMQENTVFSTTDGNLLGLPPTAYKWGAGVSMSTNGGKALFYVAHSGSQVWAKGGYGDDYSQEWKRLDGADWTDVRGRPSSVNHYGFLDFDITDVMEADLNHITKPGLYGQGASAGATLNRNYPIQEAGTLLVTPSAYGVQQEYTSYYTNQKYVRGKLDTVWQSWKRIDGLSKEDALVEHNLDLTSLDQNRWYPVLMQMPSARKLYRFALYHALYEESHPSWGLHEGGFGVRCEWEVMPSSWGIWHASGLRLIKHFEYIHCNQSPLLNLGQIPQESKEYVYLRGGAKYRLYCERDVKVEVSRGDYHNSSPDGQHRWNVPMLHAYDATLVPKPLRVQFDEIFAGLGNRVKKTGDEMSGYLGIRSGDWSGLNLYNLADKYFRIETNSDNALHFGSFSYRNGAGENEAVIYLPKKTGEVVLNTDFTQSLQRNGWSRLPNGLILQWGEFANCYTDSDRLLHFPIVFPVACLYVGEGKVMSPRTSTIERVQITDYSASGFYASTAQVGRGFIAQDTLTFSYFAIGY